MQYLDRLQESEGEREAIECGETIKIDFQIDQQTK